MRIIFYLIIAVSTANATIDTLQPDADLGKDAFVYEGMPDMNFGDSDHLSITSSIAGHMAVSYIKFKELNNYFSATINQATLELYVTELGSSGLFLKYGAIASAWDEFTLDWNNQPWPIPGTEEQEPYPSGIGTWWSVDVTGTVLDWKNGTYEHRGFVILDEEGDGHSVRFASSDEPDSTYWPKLILDYTGTIGIDSVSIGELKVVFK